MFAITDIGLGTMGNDGVIWSASVVVAVMHRKVKRNF